MNTEPRPELNSSDYQESNESDSGQPSQDEMVRVRTKNNHIARIKRSDLGAWGLRESDIIPPREEDVGQS